MLIKNSNNKFFCLFIFLALVILAGCPCSKKPEQKTLLAALPEKVKTLPHPFAFIVFGDSRPARSMESMVAKKVNHTREVIIKKIAELKPAFVVNTGDLVLKGSSKTGWEQFDRENQVFQEQQITYYPVLGNHEYKGKDRKALDNYFTRFPHINRQKWYSFRKANCLFILLDSNFDEFSPTDLNRQNQWLKNTLASAETDSDISFVFAFFHHPPYTNGTSHKPNQEVQKHFVPLFEKSSKLKFVFCGHVHTYERFLTNNINYIVTGGGGAPLHKLLEPKKWRYPDQYGPNKPRATHFCILTVWQDKVQFRTLHLDPDKLTWQQGDSLSQGE